MIWPLPPASCKMQPADLSSAAVVLFAGWRAALPSDACNNPRQRALSCEPVEDQMFATLLLITLCMTVYAFAVVMSDG